MSDDPDQITPIDDGVLRSAEELMEEARRESRQIMDSVEQHLSPQQRDEVRSGLSKVFELLSRPAVSYAKDVASYAQYAPGLFVRNTLGGTVASGVVGALVGITVGGGLETTYGYASRNHSNDANSTTSSGDSHHDKRAIEGKYPYQLIAEGAKWGVTAGVSLYLLASFYTFQSKRQRLMPQVHAALEHRRAIREADGQGEGEIGQIPMVNIIPPSQANVERTPVEGTQRASMPSPGLTSTITSSSTPASDTPEVVTNLKQFVGTRTVIGPLSIAGKLNVYKYHKDGSIPPKNQQVLIASTDLVKCANNEQLKIEDLVPGTVLNVKLAKIIIDTKVAKTDISKPPKTVIRGRK